MSEMSDRYATVADGFTRRVNGVPQGRWDARTPCSEWTASDVVAHVVNTRWRVLASVEGSDPAPVAPDDDDAAWPRATEAVRAALADPVRAATNVSGMFGDQPFELLVGRLLWRTPGPHLGSGPGDGSGRDLDPQAAAQVLEFLTPIDQAARRPGGFAPKIEPMAGADTQTRLLNFTGRAV
jgi:Mycothiol maleylpyruvate isomerase N-terminal domain